MKQIGFTSAASRQWRKLSAATRAQIDLKIVSYAETGVGDIKALKGVEGLRLRVGDWRVLFTVDGEKSPFMRWVIAATSMIEETMAKAGTVRANVQFIQTPAGDDLAILPRADYDRLVALAAEAQEDADASRVVRASLRAVKEGREVVLPISVADRLADGDNPVRAIREWRDMTQGELAVAVGISQNYLSEIETGRRKGPAGLQKKFSRALGVPTDLLID